MYGHKDPPPFVRRWGFIFPLGVWTSATVQVGLQQCRGGGR